MDVLIQLFSGDASAAAGHAINALISIVCLVWTLGIRENLREPDAWRGWVGFWAGTSAFYVLMTVTSSATAGPYAALKLALLAAVWLAATRVGPATTDSGCKP